MSLPHCYNAELVWRSSALFTRGSVSWRARLGRNGYPFLFRLAASLQAVGWDGAERSLPLDGRGRLARDVVDHARDPRDLVDDAPRDLIEELIRQARPVRGHEVHGLHRAQGDHVVVAPAIAH